MGRERRDYPEICSAVLKQLDKPKTVNEIAAKLDAGWTTVEKALRFLESLGYVEKIVARPLIYKRKKLIPLNDDFINELSVIIKAKGSRYRNLEECVADALRDFIRKEKEIRRY